MVMANVLNKHGVLAGQRVLFLEKKRKNLNNSTPKSHFFCRFSYIKN